MTYQFARIDLAKTTYQPTVAWQYITQPDVAVLQDIYRTYCVYKHFASVYAIVYSQFTDPMTDVIGYIDQDQLVAFSLMKRYDDENVWPVSLRGPITTHVQD
jgi:hypothetical protein